MGGGGVLVSAGAKIAVRVIFGVGKVKGVGEAGAGSVQAARALANKNMASNRVRRSIRSSNPVYKANKKIISRAGGSRTHTRSPSEDFKSSASANSATAPTSILT